MPIITPAYPSMCSTHNISLSTKAVILRELQRGGDIVDRIFLKQLTWNSLFTRHTFFTRDYKYYLSIIASSETKEAQSVWSGFVESKVRHLVGALDRKDTIGVAHPFPKGFERIHTIHDDHQAEAVRNGSTMFKAQNGQTEAPEKNTTEQPASGSVNGEIANGEVSQADDKSNSGPRTMYTTTYYIGLELKPLEPGKLTAVYSQQH